MEKSSYITSFFDNLAYGVDHQIWQIHIANEGYDNLIFGACIDEKAKYKLRKKEIKKMQKVLEQCSPKIAVYCGNIQNQTLLPLMKWQYEKTLTPAELEDEDYEEYGYSEYRRDICLNFLKNELNEIVVQFSKTFNSIEDVRKLSHHIYERFCEFLKNHPGENLILENYLKYASIADKLPTYRSLLKRDEKEVNNTNDSIVAGLETVIGDNKKSFSDFNSIITEDKKVYILQLLEDLSITVEGKSTLTPRKKGALRGVIEALKEKMIVPNIGLATLCTIIAKEIELELKSELDASTTSEKYRIEAQQYINKHPLH